MADRAGVNPALLFRYFGNEEALFAEAVTRDAPAPLTDGPPETLLERILASVFADAPGTAMLFSVLRSGDGAAQAVREELGTAYTEAFAASPPPTTPSTPRCARSCCLGCSGSRRCVWCCARAWTWTGPRRSRTSCARPTPFSTDQRHRVDVAPPPEPRRPHHDPDRRRLRRAGLGRRGRGGPPSPGRPARPSAGRLPGRPGLGGGTPARVRTGLEPVPRISSRLRGARATVDPASQVGLVLCGEHTHNVVADHDRYLAQSANHLTDTLGLSAGRRR